jgi:hypothetical protein
VLRKRSVPLTPSEIQLTNVPAPGALPSVRLNEPLAVVVTVMVLPDNVTEVMLVEAMFARSISLVGVVLLLPTFKPAMVAAKPPSWLLAIVELSSSKAPAAPACSAASAARHYRASVPRSAVSVTYDIHGT